MPLGEDEGATPFARYWTSEAPPAMQSSTRATRRAVSSISGVTA